VISFTAHDFMTRVHGFPPTATVSATRLILGSMPGKASLAAYQYYAHPRNTFWQIMNRVLDVPSEASYEKRCQGLVEKGVALWDVLKTCTRTGSLDSDIVESSMVPNDFEAFLRAHPGIRTIFFNGAKAEKTYLRHVQPRLPDRFARIRTVRLPSTSPANASIPLAVKLEHWKVLRSPAPTARTAAARPARRTPRAAPA
jgi:TDG/mug DNA glycosylase family protein